MIEEKSISEELKERLRNDLKDSQNAIDVLNGELRYSESKINDKNKMIDNLEKKIKEKSKMVLSIAQNSFTATYKYKEEKKGEMTSQLDISGKHKRRHVRTININFIVSEEMIDVPNGTKVLVELYSDENNKLVNSGYSKDVLVNDFEGNVKFEINPKLKKGVYYFKVTYHEKILFKEKFKISAIIN